MSTEIIDMFYKWEMWKKLCFRNDAPVLNRCNESAKRSKREKKIAQTSMLLANFETSVIALLNIRALVCARKKTRESKNAVQRGTRLKWLISRYSANNYIEMCKLYASNVHLIMMEIYSMPFANTQMEKCGISRRTSCRHFDAAVVVSLCASLLH